MYRPLSTRELQAPELNRVTDRMKVSSVPTGLHHHQVAKRRVELLRLVGTTF